MTFQAMNINDLAPLFHFFTNIARLKQEFFFPAVAVIVATLGVANCTAQTTESLTVPTVAPGTPDWLREAVRADNYKEARDTTVVQSAAYSEADAGRLTKTGPTFTQPAGALTGKVVFTMAGHGWTYDTDKMYYYTQRGLSHGMVEDMGNADQMHIFAHMLFNSGATVVPLRPVDYQPNERVLDNSMPQVKFFGPWKRGTSDRYYGTLDDLTPYAFAEASLVESAVARYRPYIPESGYYPVYVWARDGDDRSNQLYRIAHSGGLAEARVNWRRVGKTWVWLGTYHFDQGTAGYVETSNKVIDPYEAYQRHVVVADAVRFGNGRGDVPRPGGISGFSREDEGDSYWIQRALGVNADRRLFDVGRDGSSTISSPPKAAAYANRELDGTFLDRVLISFHSNASSGKARGAVALFNANPQQRPSYQENLAEIMGHEVNRQMAAEDPPAEEKWSPRERNTYSGINFGELRRDYIHNEMCATIIETAFHDNAADAQFLLNPISRIQMAQATLRGLLRWYAEVAYPNSSYSLPPARPTAVAAIADKQRIQVKWQLGSVGEFSGGSATEVRIYRSSNGYSFDGGITATADAESISLDPLTTSSATFVRVTAVNGAGESFPSQTIAVYPGPGSNSSPSRPSGNLVLSYGAVLDSSSNVPYRLDQQPGGPFREGAKTQRVRAIYAMLDPSGVEEAKTLAALGEVFSGASATAFETGMVETGNIRRIFVTAEHLNPKSALISKKMQDLLREFLNKNGKLYISGSGVAGNLFGQDDAQKEFLRDGMGVVNPTTTPPGALLSSTDNRFLPTTFTIPLASSSSFWNKSDIRPAEFEIAKGRSISIMRYAESNENKSAAVLTRPSYSEGEIFYLGFPLSLVQNPDHRRSLMQAVLKQM